MASSGQVPPADRQRTHGVCGTVVQVMRQHATIGVEGQGFRGDSARLHCAAIRRTMDAKIDDLTAFIHNGDRVIMVLEKMSDLPLQHQRGNSKWNVFTVQRNVTTAPRPAAFSSPAGYMDMTTDQLQAPQGRSRLQSAKLLISIRQILSVWNVVDLATFINLWRCKSTGFSEDANSLRRFVDDCLAGVYCEFSGGKLKLYLGFDEEEIGREMKRRFTACRKQQPRMREIIDIVEDARVVETPEDMDAILDPILKKAAPREKVVAVDCEGVYFDRPDRTVTLIQLATMDGHVYIFDIKKNHNLLKSGKLKQLLEDPYIIKVIHDCRRDSAALRANFGIKMAGVFDSAVAFATIMEQCNKTGKPFRVGLKALCSFLGEDTPFKDDAIIEGMAIDRQFWAQRPLTADMKNYAAADPPSLIPHVYQALDGMISPFWRDYFDAKCKDALMEL
ncbi:uncharacterized protein [Diadema setosum]|uniref:uncharacterized protein n=1 Tax=Diadema setosum TaxID=31175 RepID=UPI003B3A75FD